jgi:L-seryl-tRNA(Ser) seleniumtransferase
MVGRKACIDKLKKHPLLRALRIDKLTLVALEETLRLYLDERQALANIPTLKMLTIDVAELASRGKTIVRRMRRALPATIAISLADGFSQAGGGSLPLLELPTKLLSIAVEGISPQEMEKQLRSSTVPVLGRIRQDAFLLDLRTVFDQDIPVIIDALHSLAQKSIQNIG